MPPSLDDDGIIQSVRRLRFPVGRLREAVLLELLGERRGDGLDDRPAGNAPRRPGYPPILRSQALDLRLRGHHEFGEGVPDLTREGCPGRGVEQAVGRISCRPVAARRRGTRQQARRDPRDMLRLR